MSTTNRTATRVTVSASLLRAAQTFAGNKDVRFYLNGVCVEPSPDGAGVLLIATDGHRLAVLFDESGEADGVAIIERHKIPAQAKGRAELRATFDGARAEYSNGVALPVGFISGTFPDWRRVIPPTGEGTATGAAAFNTDYLGDFSAIAEAYGQKWRGALVHAAGPTSSALVTFDDLPAFAVLMPLRFGRTACALPAFMQAGEPDKLAAKLRAQRATADERRAAAASRGEAVPVAASAAAGLAWLRLLRACKAAGAETARRLPFPPDFCPVSFEEAVPVVPAAAEPARRAPLARIWIQRAEGRTSGTSWNAGEAREFTGPAAWAAAFAGLNTICASAPETGGYDKTDVRIEWTNGDAYAYRFDAQHPNCSERDTPDLADHLRQQLAFYEGARRPLHMSAPEYAAFCAEPHAQQHAAELRAMLERVEFPLDLPPVPPQPNPEPPVPVPGRRCYFRGGYGSQGSGAGTVVDVEPVREYGADSLRFLVVMDRDGAQRWFNLSAIVGPRPSVLIGDDMATDLETTRAFHRGHAEAARKAAEKADAEQQHRDQVAALRAAHPDLLPASVGNAVGHNLRALLKRAGVRASVRKERGSMVSSYRVELAEGSTRDQVKAAQEIGSRFEAGHFDGMTDSYVYERSAWTEAFGGVRYVFVSVRMADGFTRDAGHVLANPEKFGHQPDGAEAAPAAKVDAIDATPPAPTAADECAPPVLAADEPTPPALPPSPSATLAAPHLAPAPASEAALLIYRRHRRAWRATVARLVELVAARREVHTETAREALERSIGTALDMIEGRKVTAVRARRCWIGARDRELTAAAGAALREICAAEEAAASQNAPTAAPAGRLRARWDAAAGRWVPVLAA